MDRWQRQRLAWQRWAGDYDARTAWVERRFLGPTRPWVCGRAIGKVLEVGVGTGANLPFYDRAVALTAVDLNLEMLQRARTKASSLGRHVDIVEADALDLPFPDATFDAVVATYVLCSVPTVEGALREMLRVLRPGGSLLLADHVASDSGWIRAGQRALELLTGPRLGEYWTRRPLLGLRAMGVSIVTTQRRHVGVLECVHALR